MLISNEPDFKPINCRAAAVANTVAEIPIIMKGDTVEHFSHNETVIVCGNRVVNFAANTSDNRNIEARELLAAMCIGCPNRIPFEIQA